MNNQKADRLKEMMLEMNLKQSEIARDCGVSSQYISAVMRGQRPVSDRLIERVSHRYGINQEWLALGVGQMRKSEIEQEQIEGMNSALGTFFADLIRREDSDRIKRLVFYLSQIDKEMMR